MRLEHFSKHEHEFVTKVNDWINQVYYSHKVKLTKFLTPREQQIIQMLVNQFVDIEVYFDGGFKNAERKRAIIPVPRPCWAIPVSASTPMTSAISTSSARL